MQGDHHEGIRAFTRLRSIVGSRFLRAVVQRTGLLGALCTLTLLVSCGKSSEPISPALSNTTIAKSGTTQSPAKFAAFAISDLTLITQTSGTSGFVTILSAPIKTSGSKGLFLSASLETGLFTQTLTKSKNSQKDTSTGSVAIQVQALIDGTPMPPGIVTYAARTQTLSTTLESATAQDIEMILNTLSATSFDFVATGVPGGDHVISVQARISSSTSVQEGSAQAQALVGKGAVVAQVFD